MRSSVRLVPPSLRVIAIILTKHVNLQYIVAALEERCYMGTSYAELRMCHWPQVKIATARIGQGLTCTYTESIDENTWLKSGFVWVAEMACHPLCSTFLGRECQEKNSVEDWLKIIEKKHREMVDKIPTV